MSLLRRRMMMQQQEKEIPIGVNLIDVNGYGYKKSYMIKSDGTYGYNGNTCVSNYIQVDSKYTFYIKRQVNWTLGCFYDKNYNFIEGIIATSYTNDQYIGPNNIKIPENAKYIRVNIASDTATNYPSIVKRIE